MITSVPNYVGFFQFGTVPDMHEQEWERRLPNLFPAKKVNCVISHKQYGLWVTSSFSDFAEKNAFQIIRDSIVIVGLGKIYYRSSISKPGADALANAYLSHKGSFLDSVHGSFSFALFDIQHEHLILATDQWESLPLYYVVWDGIIFFATRVEMLLPLPFMSRKIDPQAVYFFLYHQHVPAPITFFADIRRIPSFSTLTCYSSQGTPYIESYGDIYFPSVAAESLDSLIIQLEDKIDNTTAEMISHETGVGILFSGGIDSTFVLRSLARNRPKEISAYILASASSDYLAGAQAICHLFDVPLIPIWLQPRDLLRLPSTIQAFGEPPYHFEAHLTSLFLQQLNPAIPIFLTGNAADALFSPNKAFLRVMRKRWKLSWLNILYSLLNLWPASPIKACFAYKYMLQKLGQEKLFRRTLGQILDPDMMMGNFSLIQEEKIFQDYLCASFPPNLWQWQNYVNLNLWGRQTTAVIPGRLGIAFGHCLMSPFLAPQVVEFALRLPLFCSAPDPQHSESHKYILCQSLMADVPEQLIPKVKRGFGDEIHLDLLIQGPFRPVVEKLLFRSSLCESGFFNNKGIGVLYDSFIRGFSITGQAELLWALSCFVIWYELYILEKDPVEIESELVSLIEKTGQFI